MTWFFFILGLLQCCLAWRIGQSGSSLEKREKEEKNEVARIPPRGWPALALIIPVSGERPDMEPALRGMLEQNYPRYTVYMVCESENDPAAALIDRLRDEYPELIRVIAGATETRGQKNHNLLAGVAAAGEADVFAFCDSTHVADPDFLRCLIDPIAKGETAFSTGYHKVIPGDDGIITLAYCMTAFFMRCLQGMAAFTQPWGGAMAMTKAAFVRYDVAALWSDNVVDDCSLAGYLLKRGVHVRLCPGATLTTHARNHSARVWSAWLLRQILFLKFCVFPQWLALGLVSLLMITPPLWALEAVSCGVLGVGGGAAPFLALIWAVCLAPILAGWRTFLPEKAPFLSWLAAFFCACAGFFGQYLRSVPERTISWSHLVYRVGHGGKVLAVNRKK